MTLGEPSGRFTSRFTVYANVIALEDHELGYALASKEVAPAATAFIDLFESMLHRHRPSVA